MSLAPLVVLVGLMVLVVLVGLMVLVVLVGLVVLVVLGSAAAWVWKRLLFSEFPPRLSFGRPRPPVLSSLSGCGVVTGTSQSAVGGDTQRLRSLSKTSITGHR